MRIACGVLRRSCRVAVLPLLAILSAGVLAAQTASPIVLPLWPSGAPGAEANPPAEKDATTPSDHLAGGRPVIRFTNVSHPTLALYKADPSKDTGAAVVVFPGGAYRIVSYDLEGTEICEWLRSIGVSCALVKYRVPTPAPHTAPLQDAQRAVGLVRAHAAEWHIDPQRIGVMGFSAGGHLSANLSNNYATRQYPPVDGADQLSCRPDFTILIYPAYIADNEGKLARIVPNAQTPPTFLVQTEDDPIDVRNSLDYYVRLAQAKVPAEMHIFAKGGHGYGVRSSSQLPVGAWPSLLQKWLQSSGFLKQ